MSKIVLKCWLDDNLKATDLQSRVRICDISDSPLKFEYSFLIRSLGIAVDYCYNRANLSDEKQIALEEAGKELRIIHIVDRMNGGTNGQYPEWIMKIQSRQKYCLLLSVSDSEYAKAEMTTVFYEQDLDSMWKEVIVAAGLLKDYQIDSHGDLFYKGTPLKFLVEAKQRAFKSALDAEKEQRELRAKQLAEEEKMRQEEFKRRMAEAENLRKALAEQKKQEEEAAALKEEQRRLEKANRIEERRRQDQDFEDSLPELLSNPNKPVYDRYRNRWLTCEFCGKRATDSEFVRIGKPGNCNLGVCRDCSKNKEVQEQLYDSPPPIKKVEDTTCPLCGGKLRKKFGPFGTFWGCSNYPNCLFRKPLKSI